MIEGGLSGLNGHRVNDIIPKVFGDTDISICVYRETHIPRPLLMLSNRERERNEDFENNWTYYTLSSSSSSLRRIDSLDVNLPTTIHGSEGGHYL